MQDLLEWTIKLLQPAIAPFLMVTGAITAWKKWGHLFIDKKSDRRKDTSDWIERFLKIQETSNRIMQSIDSRLEHQNDLIEKSLEHQADLKHRISRIYEKVVEHHAA